MRSTDEIRTFLNRWWAGEDTSRPAVRLLGFAGRRAGEIRQGRSRREQLTDPAVFIPAALAEAEDEAAVGDDNIPAAGTYIGVPALPSAFGCEVGWPDNQDDPWCHPVARTPDEARELTAGDPAGGMLADVLELTRSIRARFDGPIRVTDIQGPLDTASLVWDTTDFLTSMYTDPDAVDHVLDRIVELIIAFVRSQQDAAGGPERLMLNHNPCLYMPSDTAISLSDDLLAMVSPDLYRRFGIPAHEKLTEAFGGVFIHSCGRFDMNHPVLLEHSQLAGVNFNMGENDPDVIVENLGGKTVLAPRLSANDEGFALLGRYVDAHRRLGRDLSRSYLIIDRGRGDQLPEDVFARLDELGIVIPR